MCERLLRGVRGEGDAVLIIGDEATLPYTGTLHHPGVIGVEDFREIIVGNDAASQGAAYTYDLAHGVAWVCPRGAQTASPAERSPVAARASPISSTRPEPAREIPRRAFSTPLARELPCPIITKPRTPSKNEPP